jgi:hypothetical protein
LNEEEDVNKIFMPWVNRKRARPSRALIKI